MNQVERWFGLLTDKLIRRGVHTSVKALENDIRDWIDTWNENPRSFTWTKTADESSNPSPTTSPKSTRRPLKPEIDLASLFLAHRTSQCRVRQRSHW